MPIEQFSFTSKKGGETDIEFTSERTITTGGTGEIQAGTATIGNRDAGHYIIKREYYEGDIDDQVRRYQRCRDANLPVPKTFRKGADGNGNSVLIISDLLHGQKNVWSLNDSKERSFPDQDDTTIEAQLDAIAIVAAEKGIGIEAYAYLAVIGRDDKVEILIGDFGNTEIRFPFEDKTDAGNYPEGLTAEGLKERNIAQAKAFLKGAGLVETETPEKPQSIPVSL